MRGVIRTGIPGWQLLPHVDEGIRQRRNVPRRKLNLKSLEEVKSIRKVSYTIKSM